MEVLCFCFLLVLFYVCIVVFILILVYFVSPNILIFHLMAVSFRMTMMAHSHHRKLTSYTKIYMVVVILTTLSLQIFASRHFCEFLKILNETIREILRSRNKIFPPIRENKCRKFCDFLTSRKFLLAKNCTPKVPDFYQQNMRV